LEHFDGVFVGMYSFCGVWPSRQSQNDEDEDIPHNGNEEEKGALCKTFLP
jgi:hypothetical protein